MQEILVFLQHHWLLSTAMIIIFILLVLIEFKKIKQPTNNLTPLKVTQLINHENAVVIDLRSSDAFSTGHIVGAISIPFRELDNKIKQIEKFKITPIVLVCATGLDSASAMLALTKQGFSRVYLLNGGIRAWKAAEMPLVKG